MANPGEVFCLCNGIINNKYDSKMDYIGIESIVLPNYPLKCIKTGATQLDEAGNNLMQNMDIFECPFCKVRIAKR